MQGTAPNCYIIYIITIFRHTHMLHGVVINTKKTSKSGSISQTCSLWDWYLWHPVTISQVEHVPRDIPPAGHPCRTPCSPRVKAKPCSNWGLVQQKSITRLNQKDTSWAQESTAHGTKFAEPMGSEHVSFCIPFPNLDILHWLLTLNVAYVTFKSCKPTMLIIFWEGQNPLCLGSPAFSSSPTRPWHQCRPLRSNWISSASMLTAPPKRSDFQWHWPPVKRFLVAFCWFWLWWTMQLVIAG